MPILSSPIRRVITLLLGLALLGALWTTALGRLSSEGTAVPMLTNAGTELLNPLLTANGNGVAQGAWNTIQQQAAAHPDLSVSLPGISAPVQGRDIAGLSFADGTRVIYTKVAQTWYEHGINFAFKLPAPLQNAVSTYDPFVSKSLNVPGLPKVSLPQIPGFLAPLVTHLGLSPTTLTAAGHRDMLNLSHWFWIVSALLALALAIFSSGWHRLSNPAWSLFHASWHIALVGVAAWFLINHNKAATAHYMGVVGALGGAFFPVYGTAALVGLAGGVGSVVAKRTLRIGAGLGRMAARHEEALQAAPVRRPVSQPPYQPPAPAPRPPYGQPPFDQPQNYGGQGYGQAQPPRPSFGNQGGYQPTEPLWDLPGQPPANAPQQPMFPGSPDYAPRPRGAAYPQVPQPDLGALDYGQPQPNRPQQPSPWSPNLDRDSGGW